MSDQEALAAMGEQAAETEAPETTEAQPPEQSDQVAVPPHELAAAVSLLVGVGGNMVCQRAGVTGLDSQEVDQMAAAAVNVLDLYDLRMNKYFAAWAGLGMTLTPIVAMRTVEYQANRAAAQEPKQPIAPEPPETDAIPEHRRPRRNGKTAKA